MNKKKKNTRIKHRRNQNRVKKILQTSLLKAKPKKIIQSTKTDVLVEQVEAKPITEKTTTKKTTAKKTTAKKTTAKKTTAKKESK